MISTDDVILEVLGDSSLEGKLLSSVTVVAEEHDGATTISVDFTPTIAAIVQATLGALDRMELLRGA